MSQDTLDILNQHRANQLSLSPSSEEFTIQGGSTFFGIFDNAHYEEPKDRGNVTGKKRMPVIMVDVVPSGLTPDSSVIIRENGDEFTFQFAGRDKEGVPLLWLY